MNGRRLYVPVLLFLGVCWGSTQALGKIAASTGHGVYGLIVWQGVIGLVMLGALTLLRGKSLRLTREGLRFAAIIAVVGTVAPTYTFYTSVVHLPAGIMSVLISAVPLFSFPMAMALGMDRFSFRRLLGLVFGLLGVSLIAMPGASLPDPAMAIWVPLALLGPLFYALEGNIVARWGTYGLDPVQAMFWANLLAVVIVLPVALATGQMFSLLPLGRPEAALLLSSGMHALLYATYVWLNTRAGPVFAAQVAYFVTGSGVFWAMGLVGERFSPLVWLALAVMLFGLFLVQPRNQTAKAA